MAQDDAINNGNSISSAEQSNIAGTNSGEKSIIETSKRKPEITHEDLEQHFRKKLDDVAKIFNVSRSTIKRICREHTIFRWPQRKIDNVNDSLFMSDLPCSDLSRGQAMVVVAHTRPSITTMQDVKSVTIKATYVDIYIKLQLTSTARMVELDEEIVKRLKLKVGCFRIKCMDEDNDWILLACDMDLQNYINTKIALGTTTMKMLVELNSN
ncbi:hypothetical protein F0562_025836 [Nyssa sinensis]|uniref:RWP-RK domain-containing protein n=1 Tax=Nyssa sinensis TaxID=561372 RepID=A0A5J5B950_9ASTE|nr:hypothetical protein F0562_025836 [Nyssa sinensis]